MKLADSRQSAVSSRRAAGAGSRQVGISFTPTRPELRVKRRLKSTERFLLIRCIFIFAGIVSFAGIANAQRNSDSTFKPSPVEMAGTMRSNGKIYVVVAVLVIILLGLFFYLTRLDRKITRLEKGTWKE